MSVINKMLRDLDARHAGDRKSLPNEVRPLPTENRRSPPLMAITGALILVGIGGWAWWITSENTHPAPPLAVTPASPAPVPTPQPVAAASEPTATPVAPAPATTTEPPAVAPVVAQAATPPAVAPIVAPAATPSTPPPAAPAPTAEPASKAPPPPVAKETATKVPAAKKTETTSAKSAAPAGVSSLRLETSLRQIPSMAETAAPKSTGPVEKQVRGGSSEQAEAAYRKATAANRQGRSSEAVDALREALKADPRHVSARQLLLSILVERKQFEEASALLREGLELLPQQSAWAMALARIEVEKGQLPQAWETLQRTLPQAESNADYRGFAGALLQRLQKPKEAILHYQAAVRLKPAESRWWLGLGMALEADGRSAEAREAYQKAQAAGNLGAEGTALVEQKLR